jgi:hypothetical protein
MSGIAAFYGAPFRQVNDVSEVDEGQFLTSFIPPAFHRARYEDLHWPEAVIAWSRSRRSRIDIALLILDKRTKESGWRKPGAVLRPMVQGETEPTLHQKEWAAPK